MVNKIKNFTDFFNSLDLFFFILNLDGTILLCNQTVHTRLEYSEQELIGNSVLSIHPKSRQDEAKEILTQIVSGVIDICPIPIESKSGKLIDVETKIIKGFWDENPVLFCVSKDISELTLSNSKFSAIFKFSPVPLAITRLSDGMIIEVNESWITLLEFTFESVKNKTVYDLDIYVNPKDRQEILNQLKIHKRLENYPITLKTSRNNILYGKIYGTEILINNEPCWVTSFIDQTREKMMEKTAIEFQNKIIQDARDGLLLMLNQNKYVI